MSKVVNYMVKSYLSYVYKALMRSVANPISVQDKVLYKILQQMRQTKYGKEHNVQSVKTFKDFQRAFPIVEYESLFPYIERMLMGESDVLVNGFVKYFSKSSGTTNDKSKFIPVSYQNMRSNHFKGGWESLALFYNKKPDAQIFHKKNLMISGALAPYIHNKNTIVGDVSAVLTHNIPALGRAHYAPSMETALMPDWDQKIVKILEEILQEDLVMFGGVPTWMLVICREALKVTGKSNLLEIWPNLQGYFHGGVGFQPYFEQFKELIPSDQFLFHEVYNSSEGFFGAQDRPHDSGMLMLLNNGVYYEFLPMSEWDSDNPESISLKDVEINTPYALIITSNNGLARYKIGDVVTFSSLSPYRFMVTGRTKHFINTFGEEVMVGNTDMAISKTCTEFNTNVSEYTVAPIYMTASGKGGHEWIIEFDKEPSDLEKFADKLDRNLRDINSDYDAKRAHNLAMERLKIVSVPKGTFLTWMRDRKKLGGQNKVPRLSNNRDNINDILKTNIEIYTKL